MDMCWSVPLSESTLRHVARNIDQYIPPQYFSTDVASSVKYIDEVREALLGTAALVNISPTQRADACNILCLLLERCALAPVERYRARLWESCFWMRLFDIYLERSHHAKAKCMRQVINGLTVTLKRNVMASPWKELRDSAVFRLFSSILHQHDHAKSKQALQAITVFLTKQLFSLEELLEAFKSQLQMQSSSLEDAVQILLKRVFDWMVIQETALAASHLISTLMEQARYVNALNRAIPNTLVELPIWVLPLQESFNGAPHAIHSFKSHIFPKLFKADVHGYASFLEHLGIDLQSKTTIKSSRHQVAPGAYRASENLDLSLLLASVQTGKEIGLVFGTDGAETEQVTIKEGIIYIPDILLGQLLIHDSPSVRIAALSALTSSGAITRPITDAAFDCLKYNLSHLHAETDSGCRSEILGIVQRLIDRLRATCANQWKHLTAKLGVDGFSQGSAFVQRAKKRHAINIDSRRYRHQGFLQWYINFLATELRPGAPYQRHVAALQVLTILLRSGLDPYVPPHYLSKQAQGQSAWPFHLRIVTEGTFRMLLDLMMNPYEDVRDSTAQVIKLLLSYDTTQPCSCVIGSFAEKTASESPVQIFLDNAQSSLVSLFDRSEALMLRTGRTEHADGVSQMYSILAQRWESVKRSLKESSYDGFIRAIPNEIGLVKNLVDKLENAAAVANRDLAQAVEKFPIHGYFASIRRILDESALYSTLKEANENDLIEWRATQTRLFLISQSIWHSVRGVLCNDAPEGHIPDYFEEADLSTKDILSYSWRALKEASILTRVIIQKAPYDKDVHRSLLSEKDLRSAGDLCFTQLSELRHRGAFSTVAQTFASCCERCISVKEPIVMALPLTWYRRALLCIREQASVLTRRSAGLPSLLIGIVSAEPGGNIMKTAFEDLFVVAQDEIGTFILGQDDELPQVHAMNCLTALFSNPRLAKSSETFIAKGLNLSAGRLQSDVWAVRNAGLMLFRSLIDRIVGTHYRGRKSMGETEYPTLSIGDHYDLLNVVRRLMEPGTAPHTAVCEQAANGLDFEGPTESVFPALQILQCISPLESHLPDLRRLVLQLTGHSHWHIRDMAARTIRTLFRLEDPSETVESVFDPHPTSENALHGRLLAAKHILRGEINALLSANQHDLLVAEGTQRRQCVYTIFSRFSRRFLAAFPSAKCGATKANFLDIINEFGKLMLLDKKFYIILNDITATVLAQLQGLSEHNNEGVDLGARLEWSALWDAVAIHLTIVLILADCKGESLHAYLATTRRLWTDLMNTTSDRCLTVLETFSQMAPSMTTSASRKAVSRVLLEVAYIVPDNANKCQALLLATQYFCAPHATDDSRGFICGFTAREIACTLDIDYNSSDVGPSLIDDDSQIRSIVLDAKVSRQDCALSDVNVEFVNHFAGLRASINDSNPFTTRYAAALSLSYLYQFWLYGRDTSVHPSTFVRASLLVYDILNDDDDEIREVGTKIATKIYASRVGYSTKGAAVPLVASQKISKFLASQFRTIPELCDEAVRRLTRGRIQASNMSCPVQKALEEAQEEDTATFLAEKRNLFIDDVREAVIWSGVLKRISSKAISQEAADSLTEWVMEGLAILSERATREEDGALGWTSNPEVFNLGLQIIYGAEVLMHWRSRSKKVTASGHAIRKALQRLVAIGLGHRLHELWMMTMQRILAQWVLKQLRAAWANMLKVVRSPI